MNSIQAAKRINSIDVTRGLVMIIMALDHVRDMLHTTGISQSPTDLETTTPALFFTRWITHLCAPTFVFLSGTSAYISFINKNNLVKSRRFLLTRGLWLLIFEFTFINFALWFDIHFNVFFFEVIAAIGFGFIILGLLLKASTKTIGIIGLIIIFSHNLVPLLPLAETSTVRQVLNPFFGRSVFPFGDGKLFVVGYPPIPWLGVTLVGFATGPYFLMGEEKRKSLFMKIGLGSIALFTLIRFINIYGDTLPWSHQKNNLYTFLSFINVTKYPPSLQFILLFLGFMFLILAAVEAMQNQFTRIATIYGKVPLFYFVVHLYIIHSLMFLMLFLQGYKKSDLVFGFNLGRPKEGGGVSLLAIYGIWLGLLLLMYPICKWYGRYKAMHPEKAWLRYL